MLDFTPGLVSTIIPVYNRAAMAQKAVDSVLAQTYRPIEIILVDDGSTDCESPAKLDELERSHPDIIRVIHQKNGGPGLAREAGRLLARGEFIQYLDSDDWLLPNKFEVQVKALCDQPECGIAYGITRLVDNEGHTLVEPSKHTGERHEYLFPLLLKERWWHTSTPLYRRSVSDAAGPWPKQRPEDWDLEARMAARRPRLAYCDEVVSCHRDHDSAERVTSGDQLKYLKDEAWFLPRLYQCATEAGVEHGSEEMEVFARWVFMRARYLGMAGESAVASDLLKLAKRVSQTQSFSMKVISMLASTIGWRATGKLGFWHDRLLG